MFKTLKLLIIFLYPLKLLFAQPSTHGLEEIKEHKHGTHKECKLPQNTNDIIDCALSLHPRIVNSSLGLESTSKLMEKASQIPNPTISTKYLQGEVDGVEVTELETNLSFTLELGGKRDSRKFLAAAKRAESKALHEVIQSDIKIETISNLHLLRQVQEEKYLVKNILSAYAQVIAELKKLPKLSPEQEAYLTIFQISYEESKINASEIFERERKLEHFFHISTGHSIAEIIKFIPMSPKKWPKIKNTKKKQASPMIRKLKARSLLAKSEVKIQDSNAWSDIKLGPSFAIEKEGVVENQKIGINVQFPIPFFHKNGGAKSYARSEYLRAQKNVSITQSEEGHERFEQLHIYKSAVDILNKTLSKELVYKKYKNIKKLYLRGVVSNSIYFDSLKQQLSYLQNRNHRELTALSALWSIRKIDGQVLKEKL